MVARVDARGFTHRYEYQSGTGFLMKVAASGGDGGAITESEWTRDLMGRPLTESGRLGETRTFKRDVLGRVTRVEYADAGSDWEETKLDSAGGMTIVTQGSHEYASDVDGLGRVRERRSKDGTIVETRTYDAAGRLTQSQQKVSGEASPILTEDYEYEDVLGRLTKLTRTVATRDALGADTTVTLVETHGYSHDAVNRTVTETTTRVLTVGSTQVRTERQVRVVDTLGRLLAVTTPITGLTGDVTTTFEYDAQGRLVRRTDPKSNVHQWDYDAAGNLVGELDEGGFATSYSVNALGQVERQEGPHPEALLTFTYDGAGRLSARTEQTGATPTPVTAAWAFAYPGSGVVQETNPEGHLTTTTMDGRGQPIARVLSHTSLAQNIETAITYDGQTVNTTQTNEGAWQLKLVTAFDDRGRPVSREETWSSSAGAGYSYATQWTWGGRSAAVQHIWSANGTGLPEPQEAVEEDGAGNVVMKARGGGSDLVLTDRWLYDAVGRLLEERPAGFANSRQYDYGTDGRLSRMRFGPSSALEETTYAYEERGLLASTTTPDQRTLTRTYDARGLVETESFGRSSGSSQLRTFAYDAAGRLRTRQECTPGLPAPGGTPCPGPTWTFQYGPRGNLAQVTLPTGADFTYGYDGLLRLQRVTPPSGSTTPSQDFTYDALGRQTSMRVGTSTWALQGSKWNQGVATEVSPVGNTRTLTLDGRGRMVSAQYQPGAADVGTDLTAKRYTFDGFDALRRLDETRNSGNAVQAFTYDTRHLLTGVTRTGTGLVSYGYGPDGQRTTVTSPAGTITTTYDAAFNRLETVSSPLAWGTTTVRWEAGGARLEAVEDATLSQAWCYDDRGNLANTWAVAGGGALGSCAAPGNFLYQTLYLYDGRGNRVAESRQHGTGTPQTKHFAYDTADRLTSSTEWDGSATAWRLHPDGTRDEEKQQAGPYTTAPDFGALSTPARHVRYRYGAGLGGLEALEDALASNAAVATWTVDAEGRVRSETRPGQALKTYRWDVDGRLVALEVGPSGAPTYRIDYAYDGLGLRRKATAQALPTGTAQVRRWEWGGADGEEAVSETPVGATPQVVAQVGGQVLAQGTQRFGVDGLGSVVARVDAAAPQSVPLYGYAAYGAPSQAAGLGLSVAPGATEASQAFAGLRYEADANLLYAQQRWYDASTGRFLSRDSVGAGSYLATPNGLGPWGYADFNPLLFLDIDGRDAADCILKGLRVGDPEWGTDPAECTVAANYRKIELALRVRDATARTRERDERELQKFQEFDATVRKYVGRPLFFASSIAGGAAVACGCAITPGCGEVAVTATLAGLASDPDPGATLMSPVRACGTALTSGAGNATAADAECGSAVGALLFGGASNRPLISSAKRALSPGALVTMVTPEGEMCVALAEVPGRFAGLGKRDMGFGLYFEMAGPGRNAGAAGLSSGNPNPQAYRSMPRAPTRYKLKEGLDVDLRGKGKTLSEVLKMAFEKTGVALEQFQPTKWAKSLEGKTVPVEWKAPGGAEVSVDYGHYYVNPKTGAWETGPDVPHVGWQKPGKRGDVGHFLLEEVLAGRPAAK